MFGMSPAEEPGNGGSIDQYRKYLEVYPNKSFPNTPTELFDSYRVVNKPIAGPERFWSSSPDGKTQGMKSTGVSDSSRDKLFNSIRPSRFERARNLGDK